MFFFLRKTPRLGPSVSTPEDRSELVLLGSFILSYAVLLWIARSFLDAHIPFDNRILAPLYATGLVFVLLLMGRLGEGAPQAASVHVAWVVVFFVLLAGNLLQSVPWLMQSYNDGLGYSGRNWKHSALVKQASTLDSRTPVFTNAPDAYYLLTGRAASMIPSKVNPTSRSANLTYPSELAAMRKVLEERDGVLLYFRTVPWRWYLPLETELQENLPLRLVRREPEGSMYQARGLKADSLGR